MNTQSDFPNTLKKHRHILKGPCSKRQYLAPIQTGTFPGLVSPLLVTTDEKQLPYKVRSIQQSISVRRDLQQSPGHSDAFRSALCLQLWRQKMFKNSKIAGLLFLVWSSLCFSTFTATVLWNTNIPIFLALPWKIKILALKDKDFQTDFAITDYWQNWEISKTSKIWKDLVWNWYEIWRVWHTNILFSLMFKRWKYSVRAILGRRKFSKKTWASTLTQWKKQRWQMF